ncbi:hypothetical protein [Solilutibacter silvestris]|uniref:DUF3566 domain-containing protein n=1 Tax=Solilutibacter silvestris TaxID=1645665 RepID=A0A2K1Q3C2_9GAMM|nr:hypothetical protein [Lysobacter silvestris]PNS09538.1 hypothetical protein Lysil_1167 [Lysobacter silvestris]
MIIKRIDPLSVGKVSGIIYAVFGLIAAVIMLLFSSMFASMLAAQGGSPMPFGGGGIIGIILLPIVYGIIGFVGGIVSAFIYNIAAGWVGGIRIDTE